MGFRVIRPVYPGVRSQVMAQAVRNVRQVGQGQRVGRVCDVLRVPQGHRQREDPQAGALVLLGAC